VNGPCKKTVQTARPLTGSGALRNMRRQGRENYDREIAVAPTNSPSKPVVTLLGGTIRVVLVKIVHSGPQGHGVSAVASLITRPRGSLPGVCLGIHAAVTARRLLMPWS